MNNNLMNIVQVTLTVSKNLPDIVVWDENIELREQIKRYITIPDRLVEKGNKRSKRNKRNKL